MDKQKIAENLRNLRGSRTREEVAIACGVTASAISNYENGIRIPSDEVKVTFSRYYGVPVGDIFFTDGVHETSILDRPLKG